MSEFKDDMYGCAVFLVGAAAVIVAIGWAVAHVNASKLPAQAEVR